MSDYFLEAGTGCGFTVQKGDFMFIKDVEGEQVADVVFYTAADKEERFDPTVTMDASHSYATGKGSILYSNIYRPLATVVEDTVEQHDLLNSACRPEMYEFLYGEPLHRSCFENLNEALRPFGIPAPHQHYPWNVFMNTVVGSHGSLTVERPRSRRGDFVVVRAEVDLIVAVSACPCAESACNGFHCTPIAVSVSPTL
ncbi:MAG: urea carboxylase-associated family protein [Alicyclobacillaceae bacterium]|nr:urea carboxylase-associated family protein [Alicyclobacillaceae bacterium]MCY0896211.1 urea carboxylase-associated family protein [Alicyclobacillaceae bacterium]